MMHNIIAVLVFLVAAEHIFILMLEMFYIKTSAAKRAFGLDSKLLEIKEVRVLFANQGLYNGFLAAGLFWSFFVPEAMVTPLRVFFLACVIIAALYGSITANKKIIVKQGGLAILAMLAILVSL
ncbi:membrane protein [Clostridium zeae]|uniref:Membrane protein n=1 Tax=Clostridium zeae TaxID=2759022 RepID=A0ABQ1EEJ9_9CLOT|nr:DUF1304 domain-containing protein [Clostridium zeae]GFZ33074.1 membrane protein [Clostridium zeae]